MEIDFPGGSGFMIPFPVFPDGVAITHRTEIYCVKWVSPEGEPAFGIADGAAAGEPADHVHIFQRQQAIGRQHLAFNPDWAFLGFNRKGC